jgi:TolB-like protein/DNA-binding SARP family transcriptional activator/Tfp pilus assembly protein PilF
LQRLRLFGGIAIEVDGQPLAGRAVQRRRLALLALLATSRARGGAGAGSSRDKLIALLWPTANAENGRRYLSDSVYRVNDALGAEVITGEGDTLRLDSALLPSDVVDFHAAHSAGDHATAVALHSGPLMDGFFLPDSPDFERWIDGERERLASEYARSLEALADEATQRHAHADAVRWLRMLAAHDPYSSRVAVLLMKGLRNAGDRAGAIRHARVHEELLKQDLELVPDPQVAAFAETLRKETAEPHADHSAPAAPPVVQQSSVSSVPSVSSAVQPLTVPRRWLLPAAALLVLAVAAAGFVYSRTRQTAGPVRSVAVLPFANLSADSANEYFSDGMTEELITTLGRVHGLEVASRTSAFAYKGRRLDIRDIGRELGVDAVVEGSVRKSGTSLRINTQLVDARTGYRLWSEAYDREADDVIAVQEEIARAIAGRVTGALPDVDAPVQQGGARNFEAYDLYLRGRYAWHRRTPAGLQQAIEYFSKSVALDSSYARAHAGLGDAYAVSAFYDFLPPREAYPRADSATSRALHHDPGLAAAYTTRGYVLTYYHLDWPEAERMFERAIAIDPSYSVAHQWYGNLLTVSGRFADAEREFRLAQETDPLSLIASAAHGWSLYYAGRYVAALEQVRTTLALNDRYSLAHLWGGWALEALGRNAEAIGWLRRADELSGGSDLTRLALAHGLASMPDGRDSALAILGAMDSRGRGGEYVPAYEIAKVHLALGDRAQALRWLERAVADRSHSRAFLRVDPQLRPLAGDARFERLVSATLAR